MTPVTKKFPLFKLPFLAWRNVFQTMEIMELITATFCSTRLKHFISAMNRKKHIFEITFRQQEIEISVENNPTHVLELAVYKDGNLYKLRSGEVSSSFNHSWELFIARLMDVFKCQGVYLSFWDQNGNFGIEDILGLFNGLNVGSIFSRFSPELYSRKIMENHPNVRGISLDQRPDIERLALNDIFSNTLHEEITIFFPVYFIDIVAMNAERMMLWFVRMDGQELNATLTMWMTGWNPGLKFMMLKTRNNEMVFNPAIINGLETELINEDYGIFNGKPSFKKKFLFKKDGETKATVEFCRYGGVLDCYLYVEA